MSNEIEVGDLVNDSTTENRYVVLAIHECVGRTMFITAEPMDRYERRTLELTTTGLEIIEKNFLKLESPARWPSFSCGDVVREPFSGFTGKVTGLIVGVDYTEGAIYILGKELYRGSPISYSAPAAEFELAKE